MPDAILMPLVFVVVPALVACCIVSARRRPETGAQRLVRLLLLTGQLDARKTGEE